CAICKQTNSEASSRMGPGGIFETEVRDSLGFFITQSRISFQLPFSGNGETAGVISVWASCGFLCGNLAESDLPEIRSCAELRVPANRLGFEATNVAASDACGAFRSWDAKNNAKPDPSRQT